MYKTIFIVVSCFVLASCKPEIKKDPSANANKNTLVKTIGKLISERPIKKMHQMTLTTERSRAIICSERQEICQQYSKTMSLIIEFSRDGALSREEYLKLKSELTILKQMKL